MLPRSAKERLPPEELTCQVRMEERRLRNTEKAEGYAFRFAFPLLR